MYELRPEITQKHAISYMPKFVNCCSNSEISFNRGKLWKFKNWTVIFLPRDSMQARPMLSCGVRVRVCVCRCVCVCVCACHVRTFCQNE